MREIKRTAVVAAMAGLMSVAVATPALAHGQHVGGGHWWHGNDNGWIYSEYQHFGRRHGSSVQAAWYDDSGCQRPDVLAVAGATDRPLAIDQAYYRWC